jgi:hypothetical protein
LLARERLKCGEMARGGLPGLNVGTRLFLKRFSSNHFDLIMDKALIPLIITIAINTTSMAYSPRVAPDSSLKNFLIRSMFAPLFLRFGFRLGSVPPLTRKYYSPWRQKQSGKFLTHEGENPDFLILSSEAQEMAQI